MNIQVVRNEHGALLRVHAVEINHVVTPGEGISVQHRTIDGWFEGFEGLVLFETYDVELLIQGEQDIHAQLKLAGEAVTTVPVARLLEAKNAGFIATTRPAPE